MTTTIMPDPTAYLPTPKAADFCTADEIALYRKWMDTPFTGDLESELATLRRQVRTKAAELRKIKKSTEKLSSQFLATPGGKAYWKTWIDVSSENGRRRAAHVAAHADACQPSPAPPQTATAA
jgi:hypothetical protein